MIKKSHIYWYCQFIGWSFYIVFNSIYFGLNYQSGIADYIIYFIMLLAGIGISHAYRELVLKMDVLSQPIPVQLVYIVVSCFLKGVVFCMVMLGLSKVFRIDLNNLSLYEVLIDSINYAAIFLIWNVIYFGFHYFQNYKKAEINSLKYLAATRESELNNLKAQLNPHFIFNAMNSIRALVDESPVNAKAAVTSLSNILRKTLMYDKSREIAFSEEMKLVNDYLELEKIRYEERLNFEFKISPEVEQCLIPPFLVQTQVENAIKHGISKLPGPGKVIIEAHAEHEQLMIKVSNTGVLNSALPLTGVGFKNSLQRLDLLYGKKAAITIHELNDWVVVEIHLPLK